MTAKLLLRIASIIMLLHALGHTMGIYGWNKPKSKIPADLVKQMTEMKFDFMGKASTMGSFYEGMGYGSTIALLLIVSILWIISGVGDTSEPIAAKILIPVTLFLILLGIDEVIYFFPMAAAFSLVSAALSAMAYIRLNKH